MKLNWFDTFAYNQFNNIDDDVGYEYRRQYIDDCDCQDVDTDFGRFCHQYVMTIKFFVNNITVACSIFELKYLYQYSEGYYGGLYF